MKRSTIATYRNKVKQEESGMRRMDRRTSSAAFCSGVPCTINLNRWFSSDSIILRYLRECFGSSAKRFFCSSVSVEYYAMCCVRFVSCLEKRRHAFEVGSPRSGKLLRKGHRDPCWASNPMIDLLDFGLDGREELNTRGA